MPSERATSEIDLNAQLFAAAVFLDWLDEQGIHLAHTNGTPVEDAEEKQLVANFLISRMLQKWTGNNN